MATKILSSVFAYAFLNLLRKKTFNMMFIFLESVEMVLCFSTELVKNKSIFVQFYGEALLK